jgi:transposase
LVPGASEGGRSGWINRLLGRRPFNVVVSAAAIKLARIVWVLLARDESWRSA